MNPEEIDSKIKEIDNTSKDHADQLARLDERLKNLDGLNDRVARLNNYFQICGILLLVLGIGGGFLVSRFFAAQREIDGLTTKAQDSEQILAAQVDKAKKEFDSHVTTNPVVATLQGRVREFETAFAAADAAPNGGKILPTRTGSYPKDYTDTLICPKGTYIYGIRTHQYEGDKHGIVNDVEPLYRPFLAQSGTKQP